MTRPPIRRCSAADPRRGRPLPLGEPLWRDYLARHAAIAILFWCLLAGPALAHPHVFIDTRVEVLLNDRNEATGVRISWTYDDLYSLYIVGDMGLDPDWDGTLTAAEEAALNGFDMAWIEGFEGDTYALIAGAPLALSGPRDWTAGYAGGRSPRPMSATLRPRCRWRASRW